MEAIPIVDEFGPVEEENQLIKGLSWSQRIQGCLLFMALGMFANLMGWVAIGLGYYWKYSVLSTLGSITSLLSTMLLMGPQAQLRNMFDDSRRVATVMYLGSLLLSLVVVIAYKSVLMCILCGLLQYATLGWYTLSYIPYGREMVISLIFR